MVANLKTNQNNLRQMQIDLYFDLCNWPHSLIFDKLYIFIDSHFKKIIKKSTGSKRKDFINLKTSSLDFWAFKMYIYTPNILT